MVKLRPGQCYNKTLRLRFNSDIINSYLHLKYLYYLQQYF